MSFDPVSFLQSTGALMQEARVQRLKGGYWNEVFRVTGAGVDWAVKRYVNVLEDSLFPNLPDQESAALLALAGLNVAPEHIAYHPYTDHGAILVYGFHAGETWASEVTQVAQAIARKRQAPSEGFRAVPATAAEILQQGDRLFARCQPDDTVLGFANCRPLDDDRQASAHPVLIHTDIGAGNLIVGPAGLRIIDWQCPAAGLEAEDAYSFLSPAFQILNGRLPLPMTEREVFLAALDAPSVVADLQKLEAAFAYRMAGYCCLRYQMLNGNDEISHARYVKAAAAELAHIKDLQS